MSDSIGFGSPSQKKKKSRKKRSTALTKFRWKKRGRNRWFSSSFDFREIWKEFLDRSLWIING